MTVVALWGWVLIAASGGDLTSPLWWILALTTLSGGCILLWTRQSISRVQRQLSRLAPVATTVQDIEPGLGRLNHTWLLPLL